MRLCPACTEQFPLEYNMDYVNGKPFIWYTCPYCGYDSRDYESTYKYKSSLKKGGSKHGKHKRK